MILKKLIKNALLPCLILASATHAHALTWNWSFAGEEGQFETDGASHAAGTYTLSNFSVTASVLGNTIGSTLSGAYTMSGFSTLPPYLMEWDGSSVTKWISSGVNSFDWWVFGEVASSGHYFFGWETTNINNPGHATFYPFNADTNNPSYRVSVVPAREAPKVPDSGSTVLLLALSGLGMLALKKRFS